MFTTGLEAFLAVARTLNVSRAAAELNLGQSTVTKRLNNLEAEVGTALFERRKGAKIVSLTPAGEEFLEIAQRVNLLRHQAQELRVQNHRLCLNIGILDSLSYAVFPPVYRSLSQHEPKIRLSMITSHSPELYDLVDRRQVDVAFSLIERPYPTIVAEKFFSEPMVVLRPSSFCGPDTKLVSLDDLDPYHELYLASGVSFEKWHSQWRDHSSPDFIRLDSAQLVLSFLCREEQWAIVPLSVAKMAKSRGPFSFYYLADPPPERICYKLTHKYPKASTVASLAILDHYLRIHIGALLEGEFLR